MFSRFGFWPLGPIVSVGIILGVLAVAGVVFSVVMLIDCLKRPAEKFANPLTKNGEYDKLVWAAAIIISLWFYFLGAIVYFFVVMRAKGKDRQQTADNG
ncbi:MAG: PLDc N-terminal domain-containing protein [Euryarchaeota archaeon]|nr:PLDc N-terminal domain-containing protein [Euryarchaeota archaeon]